jgi:hypothetical protein
VIRPIRPRLASTLVVLVVLLGLLGVGAAMAHPGADQAPHQGVAAPPLQAGQLVVRGQDSGLRALTERGRRQGPASMSTLVAALVGVLAWAGLGSRIGAWRSAGGAASRGRQRRSWSRAPPRHLQPV